MAYDRAYQQRYKAENKERIKATRPKYRTKNKAKIQKQVREQKFKQRYGITTDIYNLLLASQECCCAICGEPYDAIHQKRLHVDHCHETGDVRGLLCGMCNRGIGIFSDDPKKLLAAANYLEQHGR